MSPDQDLRREPLSERLRADVRSWAEANRHDPGVALLELFAYLSDTFGAMQDEVAGEAYPARRYLSVRMQQGRVVVDTDWNEGAPGQPRYGLYRGVVVNITDPLGKGRVQVAVPSVSTTSTPWAMPCFGPGAPPTPPPVGATVWVAYEEGDTDLPVWLGVMS